MNNKKLKRENPSEEAEWMFKWLIDPIPEAEFYSKYWEKQPLFISRNNPSYYQTPNSTFSLEELKNVLRTNNIMFGKNIDITNYKDGKRYTFNEEGERATESKVMSMYTEKGYTMRILHPQEFSLGLYSICAALQEWFGCVVGANIYVTPPNAQGFAPHYDDVDVFILQVEGRKLWKIYNPIDESQELPEVSSGNFEQEEIGEPISEIWLEAGDLLYLPRGMIHQALTDPNVHSMHITLSTVQKWTWYHYLLEAFPAALRHAFDEDIEFRRTLPRMFQDYMGVMHSDQESQERGEFFERASLLATKVLSYLPFDSAADKMAINFLHDSLPPRIGPFVSKQPTLSSKIRLYSKNSVRISAPDGDEDSIYFHFNTKNSRQYREVAPQWIEFPIEATDALEFIINSFPNFVPIAELPLEEDSDKMAVVEALHAADILLVQ